MRYLHTRRGFTLTELMVALAVSSIMIMSMYGAFVQQQQVSTKQEHRAEAWQNARLTMDAMVDEIRTAGFDPGGLAGAGIVEADSVHIRFTRDLNCNTSLAQNGATLTKGIPDPPPGRVTSDEDVAYIFDARSQEIGRLVYTDGQPAGNGVQPVSSNILALNFCYFVVGTLAGSCTSNPIGLNTIRAVQITLTAKATAADPSYRDPDLTQNQAYQHYHKATLTSFVRFRNLGMNTGAKPVDLDDLCL